ncbi:hypothetical protein HPB50_025735 [Hyalomma asiaticum]|uniref:Uncharacterized protein n=1 Tax=Hyalomma asiaticum TaxID=266040 RepID=A0ACB7RU04_HYAAI|nr:hypothetical protein HPB50_025735 [Hyalomma asiaticum]
MAKEPRAAPPSMAALPRRMRQSTVGRPGQDSYEEAAALGTQDREREVAEANSASQFTFDEGVRSRTAWTHAGLAHVVADNKDEARVLHEDVNQAGSEQIYDAAHSYASSHHRQCQIEQNGQQEDNTASQTAPEEAVHIAITSTRHGRPHGDAACGAGRPFSAERNFSSSSSTLKHPLSSSLLAPACGSGGFSKALNLVDSGCSRGTPSR